MWKDWLCFSRLERYGILVLFLLICFAALYPYVYQAFFIKSSPLANHKSYTLVDSFFTSLKQRTKPAKANFSITDEEAAPLKEPQYFQFDPNTVTSSQLVIMGFSKRQAAVIENYRKKGGAFRVPSDFSKIFVVDSLMYSKLEPYISIPPLPEGEAETGANERIAYVDEYEQLKIDLNSADTIELIKLRGVGRGYARRIIAYRQLLGGYHNVDQVLEVYGFPKDLFESISPNIWVDTLSVKKININLVDYQDLRKHPYINEYQAKAIVYYRETIGNINSIDEIIKNKLVDRKSYDRIKNYLTVN